MFVSLGGGVKRTENYLGQLSFFLPKEDICLNFEEEVFGNVLVEQRFSVQSYNCTENRKENCAHLVLLTDINWSRWWCVLCTTRLNTSVESRRVKIQGMCFSWCDMETKKFFLPYIYCGEVNLQRSSIVK